MKAFEEWFYNKYDDNHRKNGREEGWKAALEWVLSKVEVSNSDGSIIQYIKDELKD